ncbi:MAG: DUF2062 domain-containing protein [Oligoflexales bacterium]|nr:DUF2062 domain-containing protein [Oligoflexales bacterium]
MKKKFLEFLSFLTKDLSSNQISAAITIGMLLGFSPTPFTLQCVLGILCLLIFRIPIMISLITVLILFPVSAFLLDPFFDSVGAGILNFRPLGKLFRLMDQMPIMPLTQFKNSVVMGSLAITLILSPCVFITLIMARPEIPQDNEP